MKKINNLLVCAFVAMICILLMVTSVHSISHKHRIQRRARALEPQIAEQALNSKQDKEDDDDNEEEEKPSSSTSAKKSIFKKTETPAEKMQRRRDGLRKARAEKAGKTSKADEAKKAPVIVNKKDEDENASKEEEKDLENDDAEDEDVNVPDYIRSVIFEK